MKFYESSREWSKINYQQIYFEENMHRLTLKNGTGRSTKGNGQLSLNIFKS